MQNNVGMNDLLVDSGDYPRADIDVYQVRHARNKIRCKYLTSNNNDFIIYFELLSVFLIYKQIQQRCE